MTCEQVVMDAVARPKPKPVRMRGRSYVAFVFYPVVPILDWLEEVDAPEHSTLDFPAIEGDVQHRERIDTPRVRHLFPVPDDADWEVRELKYDHYRAG